LSKSEKMGSLETRSMLNGEKTRLLLQATHVNSLV